MPQVGHGYPVMRRNGHLDGRWTIPRRGTTAPIAAAAVMSAKRASRVTES